MSELSEHIRKCHWLRCWKPHIILHVFCPPALNSLLLSHLGELGEQPSTELLSPLLGSPFNELCCPSGSSSQPRLIQAPQDKVQKLTSKFDRMEQLLKESGFDSKCWMERKSPFVDQVDFVNASEQDIASKGVPGLKKKT